MDAISDGSVESVVIMSSAQVGKALAVDTPIATPSGWTTMGALRPGDIIFDETGAPCRVTFATDVMRRAPLLPSGVLRRRLDHSRRRPPLGGALRHHGQDRRQQWTGLATIRRSC